MHALLVLLLFGLTFGPKVSGFDVISATALLLVVRHLMSSRVIHAGVLAYALLLVGALGYAATITAVYGAADLYHVLRIGRALLNFAGAYALVTWYASRYEGRFADRLLADLFIVIALHSALMAAMYISPSLRDGIYATTGFDESYDKATAGWRISGLTEGLGTLSVTQAAGLLIAPFARHMFPGLLRQMAFGIAVLLVALSVVLSGRSGLVLAAVFMPIVLMVAHGRRWRRSAVWSYRSVKANRAAVVLAVILAVVTINTLDREVRERMATRTMPHAFEMIRSLLDDEGLQTASTTDVIEDQFFLPDSASVLLFGNSNSGRGALEDIPSDTGAVRMLFGLGLIGSSLVYIFYVAAMVQAWQVRHLHRGVALVSLLFSLGVMIANFKTVLALTRNGFTISATLIVATILLFRSELASPEPAAGAEAEVAL